MARANSTANLAPREKRSGLKTATIFLPGYLTLVASITYLIAVG